MKNPVETVREKYGSKPIVVYGEEIDPSKPPGALFLLNALHSMVNDNYDYYFWLRGLEPDVLGVFDHFSCDTPEQRIQAVALYEALGIIATDTKKHRKNHEKFKQRAEGKNFQERNKLDKNKRKAGAYSRKGRTKSYDRRSRKNQRIITSETYERQGGTLYQADWI